MLSQPHVQIILLQVLLVTGTPEHLGQAASRHPGWRACRRPLQRDDKPGVCFSSPGCPLVACLCIQPSSAQALGEILIPAGGAHLQTLPGSSYKKCRRTRDPEKAPIPEKATNDTSKENLVSLSVSSNNGRWGPSCRSNPEYQRGTVNTQDLRARCKQLLSSGRPSNIHFACWPSVKK